MDLKLKDKTDHQDNLKLRRHRLFHKPLEEGEEEDVVEEIVPHEQKEIRHREDKTVSLVPLEEIDLLV
jgi:hypothetical protein